MPLFSVTNLDKPDSLQIRLDNRDSHVEYLKALGNALILAGPLLSDDGETMIGSQLIIDFPTLDAARTWANADPYAKANLFQSSATRPFKKVLPA